MGVAIRLSSNEIANPGLSNSDYDKLTIAPNYAITDSLGAIIEYSDVDIANDNANEFAVELLYTF